MKPHTIIRKTIIKRPLQEVFQFFSKAENLNLLTPAELEFKILTPLPIKMTAGALIDYRIKLNGIPFNWKTEICTWKENECFVDFETVGDIDDNENSTIFLIGVYYQNKYTYFLADTLKHEKNILIYHEK